MSALTDSLRAAVLAQPDDAELRLHLAGLLLADGQVGEAVEHCGRVLAQRPGDPAALALLATATGPRAPAPADPPPPADPPAPANSAAPPANPPAPADPAALPAAGPAAPAPAPPPTSGRPADRFDWTAAERELSTGPPSPADPPIFLSDVAGMDEVKARVVEEFLLPLRHPELRAAYGTSLRGGLLLYGPPGCGKTYLARALAGELGASFYPLALTDVLDAYVGRSEQNLAEAFGFARRQAPCVLFLDELDALGHKRSALHANPALRGTVNTLLTELDGVARTDDGVYVLAATNHPWDVDVALRRPGRLDRTVLVLPPDEPAREAVLRHHLVGRPVSEVDLAALARRTEGWSGADLAAVVEGAARTALRAAARTGDTRPIGQRDLLTALADRRPSTGPWLQVARNVALFANPSGEYDDLLDYLRSRRLA